MGYSDIKSRKQHEADAAKIAELESQLRREREAKPTQAAQPPPSQPQAVVVEQTAKKYKKRIIISWILIIGGLPFAGIPTVIGIVLLIVTKCQIWWHHG